ncbi:MAG: hypothetical protein ABJP33_10350 [Pseudoruegeria sp.]
MLHPFCPTSPRIIIHQGYDETEGRWIVHDTSEATTEQDHPDRETALIDAAERLISIGIIEAEDND